MPNPSSPQQATEPLLLIPQVWLSPALTETKELAGGVNGSVGAGVAIGSVAYPSVTVSEKMPNASSFPTTM